MLKLKETMIVANVLVDFWASKVLASPLLTSSSKAKVLEENNGKRWAVKRPPHNTKRKEKSASLQAKVQV